MDEYISREAAIEALEKNWNPDTEFEAVIGEIPAADVQPVRRGRWLRTPTYWAYCSVCGEEPPDETNITTNFCPNCGCAMEVDE